MLPLLLACAFAAAHATPAAKGWLGDSLGGLNDSGIFGEVFVVNSTTVQISALTITASGPLALWFDSPDISGKVTHMYRMNTETGFLNPLSQLGQLNADRVVLNVPSNRTIKDFSRFGVASISDKQYIASVSIPATLQPPKPQVTDIKLTGKFYEVGSGPLTILDRQTILIPHFTFLGDKSSDGYIYAGQLTGGAVTKTNGKKCYVRGWDQGNAEPLALLKSWNEDIIVDLPGDMEVYDIDFVGVYEYAVGVDFGYSKVGPFSDRIPPHMPAFVNVIKPWSESSISGPTEFEFWLGPPGKKRGYEAIRGAKPGQWVWYVNGLMAPLIEVRRGVTYQIKIFGSEFWELYISNEPSGGFNIKPAHEKPLITIYAKQTEQATKLCWFGHNNVNDDPDQFSTFEEFGQALYQRCRPDEGKAATMTWTPDASTPDEVFYGSLAQYNMGWRIKVSGVSQSISTTSSTTSSTSTIHFHFHFHIH